MLPNPSSSTELSAKPANIVTQALPYANGDLHLGHILEATQVDIFVRFLRKIGEEVYFVCADDAHGTAITQAATDRGYTEEQWIDICRENHYKVLKQFHISYDNYHSTHSPENTKHAQEFYQQLLQKDLIARKSIEQWYDEKVGMFLSDRNLRGSCPACGSEDQPGDNCDACGAIYNASDINNPVSILSGTAPVRKSSEHLFVRLEPMRETLKTWISESQLSKPVRNKLMEWFDDELRDWDISRSAPYFGIPIPGETDQFFYVWLDAPIGYLASLENFLTGQGKALSELWHADSKQNIYHFIGKDITYFHGIFWPALLHARGLQLPSGLVVHGFLTINGQKMSKSKGTFILADLYQQTGNIDDLRYLFASKLKNSPEDINLNFEEMVSQANTELVGKFINIGSRCTKMLWADGSGQTGQDHHLIYSQEDLLELSEQMATFYREQDTLRAMQLVSKVADKVNQFLNDQAPWKLKEASDLERKRDICSSSLLVFLYLAHWLSPVTLQVAENIQSWLGESTFSLAEGSWPTSSQIPALPQQIPAFQQLKARGDVSIYKAMIEQSAS